MSEAVRLSSDISKLISRPKISIEILQTYYAEEERLTQLCIIMYCTSSIVKPGFHYPS